MLAIESTYPLFLDLGGGPLDNGTVYIGVAGQNPITSPLTVYWDEAGTQPAAQPLATVNGYIVRSGTPAAVFVSTAYSLMVKNRAGAMVNYTANAVGALNASNLQAQITQINTDISSPAVGKGSKIVAYIQRLTGAVARWVEDRFADTLHAEDFGLSTSASASANATAIQNAVNAAISTGKALRIHGTSSAFDFNTPISVNYDNTDTQTLRIIGESGLAYYLTGRGTKLNYTGTTGYAIEVNGRGAGVGGANEGSPMSIDISNVTFSGNGSCDGAIKIARGWYARIAKCNFFGFTKAAGGVITFTANGSGASFAGTSTIEQNKFANSGRCVLLTGITGGVVNSVQLIRNIALDQQYFLACDFGAATPFSQNIICRGNHTEGTAVSDYYSQGAAGNWVIEDSYVEQNSTTDNGPRVDIQGSSNYGIVVERNLFSKSLGAAGTALVRIANATSVLVRGNTSNYGGSTDRYSVELQTCASVEAEVIPTAATATSYPVRINGSDILTGQVTDNWRKVASTGSGQFVGISSGDGYPGGTVCTIVNEYSKTNGRVNFSFKATITTKSGSGTSTLIGVLPLANYGNDVAFPVFAKNVTGTQPFYAVLAAGQTFATVYDATGTALDYQVAMSVGSIVWADFTYLTQA